MAKQDVCSGHIEDVVMAKKVMEDDICSYISIVTERFKGKYGVSPDAIHIRMQEITTIGRATPEHVVIECECSIRL